MPRELYALGMPAWSAAALLALALAAAVTDVRKGQVPAWLTYPAILLGLAGHALLDGVSGDAERLGLAGSLAGFAAGFLPLMLVWLAGGIGGGDAKLMGAIGALGGWRFAIAAMLYGFIAAAIMAVFVMIRRKVVRRTIRRVVTTAVLLVTPGARPADPTSPDSPRVPFAVALGIGTISALGEWAWRAGFFGFPHR